MKVVSADFLTSAGSSSEGLPRDGLAQVAMAGRSNVGKSSLINALTRRKIARTSAAPGKTRLVNVYRVTLDGAGPGKRDLYLVDLPGYGYARGGADAAAELKAVAEAYLTGERLRPERGAKPPSESEREPSARAGGGAPAQVKKWGPASREKSRRVVGIAPTPAAVLLLVDSRHPGLDADRQAGAWLAGLGIDYHVVATKVDKLSRSERARNLKAIGDIFGKAVLPVSAANGEGLDELWRMIVRIARAADRGE